eukprot:TRINITY_DN31_c0_g3_i2.p1 TRINITY_DN31_c0_g3~~TRINITY_DN31_c0_g3_i2.p1  ORF type:complete len:205 (+),score=139.28 TRINITY_DN31_c0_g3_i2:190-804(+)
MATSSKTILCHFSGLKIYPGHGKRFIRVDSKIYNLIDSKAEALTHARKNPRQISWTQPYRKVHKKGLLEEVKSKKVRRTVKSVKAIVGASLEVIRAKRDQSAALREETLKNIKENKKKKVAEKEAAKQTSAKKAATPAVTPKATATTKAAAPKATTPAKKATATTAAPKKAAATTTTKAATTSTPAPAKKAAAPAPAKKAAAKK